MPTVFIANQAIFLPSRFVEGQTISATAAAVLCEIHHNRLKAKLRYLLSRGEIAPEELQSKANELAALELSPYSTSDDYEGEADPILAEALSMARELIISRIAKEGLPPPKGIELHAKALVDAVPEIHEKARLRVEARYRAAEEAIAGAK